MEWLDLWGSAIRRAALTKMVCKDRCLDDTYRIETVAADVRGLVASSMPEQQPNTGNAVADDALGFLRQGLRVVEGFNAHRGWGGDC